MPLASSLRFMLGSALTLGLLFSGAASAATIDPISPHIDQSCASGSLSEGPCEIPHFAITDPQEEYAVNPGETLTLSGTGCIADFPTKFEAWMLFEEPARRSDLPSPTHVTHDVDTGSWTATFTLPDEPGTIPVSFHFTCSSVESFFEARSSSRLRLYSRVNVLPNSQEEPSTPQTSQEEPPTPETPSDPPAEPRITLTQSDVEIGAPLELSASGFDPDEEVEVWLHSDPIRLGTIRADASGNASGTFVVPDNVPAGSHTVKFIGTTSKKTAQTPITVKNKTTAEKASSSSPAGTDASSNTDNASFSSASGKATKELARTGADSLPVLFAASLMSLVGLGALVRRRVRA
ncbi:hypothetical protein [Schaalia cardiffensis]|uniref:hypothetical protein n=1 Tax=Schaalia cardiffensis TaxID=181487 RepID=UPI002AB00138|nr:hypothetical protein [Schaalia cardiffensis]